MGVSASAIATELGVSRQAVNKAARRGRIHREPDGTFDLPKVQATWGQNVDLHQQQRGTAAKHHPAPVVDDLPLAVEPARDPSPPTGLALIQLEQARIKLEMDQLDLDERKGKLKDAVELERLFESRMAIERQALLNWPADISASFASELGVDEALLRRVFDDRVASFLETRSKHVVD